jgi:hypothetical protein
VTASCAGGRATLVTWTPAQGYRADDLVRGPATTPSLTFKSDRQEYRVTVGCAAGEPVAHSGKDDRHGGRGRG